MAVGTAWYSLLQETLGRYQGFHLVDYENMYPLGQICWVVVALAYRFLLLAEEGAGSLDETKQV